MRAESGACNVCATPCSSCMHFNRTVSAMESKVEDEFSEEICKGKETNQCSYNDRQHTASETNNLLSASSSHDSFSENAESKVTMRTFDTSDVSEDGEMLPKLSSIRTMGKVQPLDRPRDVAAQDDLSYHKPFPSLFQRTSSRQYEERRGLECHGDNILCVAGVKDANISINNHTVDLDRKNVSCSSANSFLMEGVEKAIQPQNAPDCVANCHREIVESRHNPRRSSTFMKNDFCKKGSGITSDNAGLPQKPDPTLLPSSKDVYVGNASPKLRSDNTGDSKDMEENSSSQLRREPSQCSLEKVDSSLAGPVTAKSADQLKSVVIDSTNILLGTEDSKVGRVRSNYSFEAPMKVYPCLGTEIDVNSESLQSKSMNCKDINHQFEKPNALFAASDIQESSLQSQPISESEQSGSDILEQDVKVCDICGDAGQEEMLAICSRCSDGAEHTYCMRIMLDKVPEGRWLCEGCKLEEDAENQQPNKIETMSATPTAPSLNEISQNSGDTFNPKVLSKLDIIAEEEEANHAGKVIPSPKVSAKRHADNLEICHISKKQAIEIAGSPGAQIPSKSAFSKENSFKNLDSGKVKPAAHHATSFGSRSANNFQETAHSLGTSSPNSSRMQARLQSPLGTLSRSATFNGVNTMHKVKQVPKVSEKQKLATESTSSDARKEGSVRMFNKSASLKNVSSSHLNATESKGKTQDPRPLKLGKDQNLIERKNSFKSDRSMVSSSPKAATSMSPLKADPKNVSRDPKAGQHDVKLKTSSSPAVSNKGLVNAIVSDGYGEVKNRSSSLSSGSRSPSSNGMCNSEEQKPCQVGKSIQCHRCGERGHIAQFCTVGSLRLPAFKAKSSQEMTNKSSKWKDAVKAATARTKVHKNDRVPDQSDRLSNSSTDLCSEVLFKDQLSSSISCVRDFPSFDGVIIRQETLRSSTSDSGRAAPTINVKHPTERISSARERDLNFIPTISDESNLKPYMRKLPGLAPLLAIPSRISAFPEHYYIWQGSFELQRSGRLPDLCDGIQAHLSTCASSKVREVVNKFPYKVQLEEVPRLSSWPLQFQGSCVTEDNIALYFFAQDIQSYERNYKKLLENILKNDLALKGNIDGIELLIFASNQLPEKSQRWNRLFFLWAVFRERKENCSESLSGSQKKLCGANLGVESSVQDLPTVMAEGTVPQKTFHDHVDNELSTCDVSSKVSEAVKSSASVHFPSLSSYSSMDGNCHEKTSSLNQSSIGCHKLNQSAVEEILSSKKHTSCLSPEMPPSTGVGHLPSVLENCSLSKIPSSESQLCSEVKCNNTLEEVFRDLECRKDSEVLPSNEATTVQNDLNECKAVPIYLDGQAGSTSSSLVRQDSSDIPPARSYSLVQEAGPLYCRDRTKTRDQDKTSFMDNESLDRNMWKGLIKKEQNNWELISSRKGPHSDSPETASEASGESSRKTSQTMVYKEKMDRMEVECGKECKKMKLCRSESSDRTSSQEQSFGYGFSPKIFDLDASPVREEQKANCVYGDSGLPKNSGTFERYFFPVDSDPVRDCKAGNDSIPLQIISSDDEDQSESDVPNLELALGGKKKSPKGGNLPFFLQLIDDKSNKNKLPDPVKDDGDDVFSASLSLSLASPLSKKERTAKPVSKTEHLLPESHHVNTSVLLFGRPLDSHR
ncbi:uncharacterized protein LOC143878543 isoform X2 [Tasmannia lanceolata]